MSNAPDGARYATAEESFLARTRSDGECVIWTGSLYPNGYGTIYVNRRSVRAHRYAWERANGEIPDGMTIDHMCHNRACVNVEHLRVVTNAQNQQNRKGANSLSKTGIRGVYQHTQTGQWVASAQVDGNRVSRLFPTKEEAERAVLDMRRTMMPFSTN